MSSNYPNLGPPTGEIEINDSHGNNCTLNWFIEDFPVRFGYLRRMVSPRFECSGIWWQMVMHTKLSRSPRMAKLGLTLVGRTMTSANSSRIVTYKITLLDKYDSPQIIRDAEDLFSGNNFSLPNQHFTVTDILDGENCDVFCVRLEMSVKRTSIVL